MEKPIAPNLIPSLLQKISDDTFSSAKHAPWFPNDKQSISLYSGLSGMSLLEADLFSHSKYEAHLHRALQYVKMAEENQSDSPVNPGLFSGLGGLAWAKIRIREVSNIDTGIDSTLERIAASGTSKYDIIDGKAGIGLLFLRAFQCGGKPDWKRQACTLADEILSHFSRVTLRKINVAQPVLWGFAHGLAGELYFLGELSKTVDEDRYYTGTKNLLKTVLNSAKQRNGLIMWPVSSIDPHVEPFWCHGTCGIALSVVKISTPDARLNSLARDCISHCISASYGCNTYGQCHGLAGIAEFIIETQRILGLNLKSQFNQVLNQIMCDLASRKSLSSWCQLDPRKKTSFMLGDVGIAHLLLRAIDNRIPHPLVLPNTNSVISTNQSNYTKTFHVEQ